MINPEIAQPLTKSTKSKFHVWSVKVFSSVRTKQNKTKYDHRRTYHRQHCSKLKPHCSKEMYSVYRFELVEVCVIFFYLLKGLKWFTRGQYFMKTSVSYWNAKSWYTNKFWPRWTAPIYRKVHWRSTQLSQKIRPFHAEIYWKQCI